VCRFASDAHIPAWALENGFFCVVRTCDEVSIVCGECVCTEDRMPDGCHVERGWLALKLEGPFPFSMTGVLAVVPATAGGSADSDLRDFDV